MTVKQKNFFSWTRDKQKTFADAIIQDLDSKMSKYGGEMLGQLVCNIPPNDEHPEGTIYPIQMKGKYKSSSTSNYHWQLGMATIGPIFYLCYQGRHLFGFSPALGFFLEADSNLTIGYKQRPWANVFTKKISNGEANIEIPSKAGTMALVSDIEDVLRKYNLIPNEETTTQEEKE